jgi:hypothetical protein
MPIRIALVVCVLVFGSFAAGTAAHAGDSYGGFGPSVTDTSKVNADTADAPAPDVDQTLPWLQQPSQSPQDNSGAAWDQQGAASNADDMDDEGGH